MRTQALAAPTLGGHVAILRVDHWFKNVFVLPGIAVALSVMPEPAHAAASAVWRALLGLASICLIVSSNYTLNEVLDAPYDRHHPTKSGRPVPAGLVNIPLAYLQWLALAMVGVGLGVYVSTPYALTLGALWVMGCVYNVAPVRTKDLPYVDVLSESVNNPLRLLAGWYIIDPPGVPPASLLLSYWMIGAFFMAMKRYAELRFIGDIGRAAAYRRSFAHTTEDRLLTSVVFYGCAAMLFFGAFIMRYRLEFILSFPFLAFVMASYMRLGLQHDSPVQRPEELYKQPCLMAAVGICAAVMLLLLFVDVPLLDRIFAPTMPQR